VVVDAQPTYDHRYQPVSEVVRTVREAAVGHQAGRDAPFLFWFWTALMEGRNHSDTMVGSMVWSTTASTSVESVSRSTCCRSRTLNASIVLAAS
jgi:hypothetical protein